MRGAFGALDFPLGESVARALARQGQNQQIAEHGVKKSAQRGETDINYSSLESGDVGLRHAAAPRKLGLAHAQC